MYFAPSCAKYPDVGTERGYLLGVFAHVCQKIMHLWYSTHIDELVK